MARAVGVFFICSFVTSSLAVTSYLDWPRIHFNGTFLSDVTTVNNIRCNFMNEKFTATNLEQAFPALVEINSPNTPTAYENFVAGWSPDGSFHFKFINAVVRSFCRNSSVMCSTDDGIVGRTVSTLPYGVLVDLDTDWQVTASKLYAFKIQIGGYLEGDMKPAEIALPTPSRRVVIKSALENITWHDADYQALFSDAKELSISMTIDQYSKVTHLGRVTGTIGLTSADDPLTTTAYRGLYPVDANWVNEVGKSPFELNMANKLLVIDLSWGIPADAQGLFLSENLGTLTLVITSRSTNCRVNCTETEIERIINENKTVIGSVTIPYGNDNQWYDNCGGVLTLDLSEFSIENSAFEVKQELPGQESKIVLSELPFGVGIAVMEDKTVRLNVGDSFIWTVFVSSYGTPVENAEVSLQLGPYLATYDCAIAGCNRTLGWPEESLLINCVGSEHCTAGVDAKTDQFGFATFELTARSDPGNPRGCGLDGQVYPLVVRARIPSCDVYFADGGLIVNATDYQMNTMPLAVMIFSEFTVTSDPPTWQDVKGIFQQYHNLYPVMWKNRIVDLGTYEGVKEKVAVVSRSMRLPVNDPRFMPISRDLSRSKRDVIFRWIESGLPRYPEDNANAPSQTCVDTTQELKDLLQVAASLELSTIPPYYTAWLSLQTEYGKNLEIADLIKSVYIEEMYHLAFASNILSAIGGQVKLTDFSNIPVYPTVLGFGSVYELARDITVTLERFSIGLIADIFSGIEKPQDGEQSRIFEVVATLANLTHNPDIVLSENVIDFLQSFEEDSGCDSLRNSGSIDWNCINQYSSQALSLLRPTNIASIGSFYSYVALQLAFLESCAQTGQIEGISSTIFKSSRQISYPGQLLEVRDLSTSLSAIIEIVHEGEGGSECYPDVSDTSSELSHYYRFQEIVYGRKLERVSDANYDNKTYACLELPEACQQSSAFCYSGDPLPFYESGVWPIVANAKAQNYEQGSEAELLNNDFNSVYTSILHCIDDIYENTATMFQCVAIMRDLAIAGKKLVATSVDDGVYKGKNAAPTWSFVLRQDERAGLPLALSNQPDLESTCVDNGSVASGNTKNPLQLNLLGLTLIIALVVWHVNMHWSGSGLHCLTT